MLPQRRRPKCLRTVGLSLRCCWHNQYNQHAHLQLVSSQPMTERFTRWVRSSWTSFGLSIIDRLKGMSTYGCSALQLSQLQLLWYVFKSHIAHTTLQCTYDWVGLYLYPTLHLNHTHPSPMKTERERFECGYAEPLSLINRKEDVLAFCPSVVGLDGFF